MFYYSERGRRQRCIVCATRVICGQEWKYQYMVAGDDGVMRWIARNGHGSPAPSISIFFLVTEGLLPVPQVYSGNISNFGSWSSEYFSTTKWHIGCPPIDGYITQSIKIRGGKGGHTIGVSQCCCWWTSVVTDTFQVEAPPLWPYTRAHIWKKIESRGCLDNEWMKCSCTSRILNFGTKKLWRRSLPNVTRRGKTRIKWK